MSTHDDLRLDDAAVSLKEGAASPAEDHDETLTPSGDAPQDAPRRQKSVFALLAAVACIVFGSKLIVISALGSSLPLLDQWDGEAAQLYAPYLKGTLSFADLFALHNQHRIFVTRVLALVHCELAGEWNPRLEMIFGAIVHTGLITLFAALLMPLVAPRRRMLLACFVAFAFAVPIGYENTLWGFQSQLYWTLFFGVAALIAFAAARPFSLRWFCGLAAAILSFLSFGTGVATFLAAGILVSLQLATNVRKRCSREFAAVAVIASISVATFLLEASSGNPDSNLRTFIEGLFLLVAPTILGAIPVLWFCKHTLSRRPAVSDRAWLVLGIVGWLAIQLVLIAYGRGAVLAVRYMDIILLVYPLALVAVFALADTARASRAGRYAGAGAVAWVFTVVAAVTLLGYASVLGAIDWSKSARQQMVDVQAYFATRNVDHLSGKGDRAHTVDLYYPHPQRLAEVLADPDVRALLPPEFRPADGDTAAARNRMWLKGSFAGVTATAVHFIFSIGPALLAVGMSLFFAIGALRSMRGARQ